jgi:hypothetical protein
MMEAVRSSEKQVGITRLHGATVQMTALRFTENVSQHKIKFEA